MDESAQMRGLFGNPWHTYDQGGKSELSYGMFPVHGLQEEFWSREPIPKRRVGGMVHAEHFPQDWTVRNLLANFSKRNALKEQFFADGRMTCGPCLKDGIFKLDLLKEVDDRVKSLVQVGFAKPKGKIILELVDQKTLLREAAKINASGNLRGLTLTKYRIV